MNTPRVMHCLIGLVAGIALASTVVAQDLPRTLKRPPPATVLKPAPATSQPASGDQQSTQQPSTSSTYNTCNSGRDCPTGECWDGLCCNEHCSGNCVSCALPGHEGTCTQVPDGQDPRRRCCTAQGGKRECFASCMSGQCTFPDVGTPCGTCAACDGNGRCTEVPYDDAACGVIRCQGLNTYCRKYQDLKVSRCAALGQCKSANDPATCTVYTDLYSGIDSSGIRRECATGRAMNCYETEYHHLVWQDGSVIRYCQTGAVCQSCSPPKPEEPEERRPAKLPDRGTP